MTTAVVIRINYHGNLVNWHFSGTNFAILSKIHGVVFCDFNILKFVLENRSFPCGYTATFIQPACNNNAYVLWWHEK